MILKAIIAILLSHGCRGGSAEDGAVFTRVGTVYTGLAYGHIVMRYNLTSIIHRAQQLEEIMKGATSIVLPKQATVSDRYFLGWTKEWMKDEIQETIDKVREALHTTTSYLQPSRPKRQVLLGIATAATLGAIAGSIITQFSEEGVNDVLENKEHVLVSTVEDNLIRINQDRRDIDNLKQTIEMVIDDTKRYIIDAKRNTYGVTHLQVVMTIQQTCHSLKDAINTFEAA